MQPDQPWYLPVNGQAGSVVFTYHGLHTRQPGSRIDQRLFRNSISEHSFLNQLEKLRSSVVAKVIGSQSRLIFKTLFRNHEIVLTFDDGYANSFRAAEMFFDKFGKAPLTVFLTTGLVGSSRSIWTVEVALLLLKARFSGPTIEFDGDGFAIGSEEERLETFNLVRYKLKKMPARKRQSNCRLIFDQALPGELELLMSEYPEFRLLNLEQIREMRSIGVRFQPHGHDHEILHENQDSETMRREIVESKAFIEGRLKEKCTHFAYANGTYCDAAISILEENGFAGAFTTKTGVAMKLQNNFEIPRFTPSSNLQKYKRQLRGKYV